MAGSMATFALWRDLGDDTPRSSRTGAGRCDAPRVLRSLHPPPAAVRIGLEDGGECCMLAAPPAGAERAINQALEMLKRADTAPCGRNSPRA